MHSRMERRRSRSLALMLLGVVAWSVPAAPQQSSRCDTGPPAARAACFFSLGAELQRDGQTEEAVRAMHAAAKASPASHAGDAYFQIGYWRSRAGDGAAAFEGFSRAVKADPQNVHAWSNLGVVQQQAGRFPQALEAYETAARINPGYAQNLFNMGKVHQDLGHAQEAVDSFQRAVDAQPAYFEAYASLGGALTPMRRWKQAAEILTDALLLQPRSPEALYLLAFALMHICQVYCATCACMQAGRQAGRHTDMHACVH